MKTEQPIIFESNFYNPCPELLVNMVEKYKYKVITVLFDGNIDIIHKRFLSRDVSSERHPGLVSNNYFSDFEFFKKETQACRNFNFGDIKIIVDTSDFSKISYENITNKIINSINCEL